MTASTLPRKVLLADDERIGRGLIGGWLKDWGYSVTAVSDGAAALRALADEPSIRLLIADWEMPELDGLELCRTIRAGTQEHYVYALLLTSRDDKADVIRGLDAGADDYLIKPANPLELRVRLRAGKRVVELQEELVRAKEALRLEAMHDALTGVLNRRAILARLDEEIARVARRGAPLSVVMVDLDHFKRINDEHGHSIGDSVLREAALRIRGVLRGYDGFGRLGGEEFLVVSPECDLAGSLAQAHRVCRQFASTPIVTRAGALAVSASFGIASTQQAPTATAAELMHAADAALYRAKRAGRNCVAAAGPIEWQRLSTMDRSASLASHQADTDR